MVVAQAGQGFTTRAASKGVRLVGPYDQTVDDIATSIVEVPARALGWYQTSGQGAATIAASAAGVAAVEVRDPDGGVAIAFMPSYFVVAYEQAARKVGVRAKYLGGTTDVAGGLRIIGDEPQSWSTIMDGWSSSWWDEYEGAEDKYGAEIEADPKAFKPEVEKTIKNLTQIEQALKRMYALLSDPANKALIDACKF